MAQNIQDILTVLLARLKNDNLAMQQEQDSSIKIVFTFSNLRDRDNLPGVQL